MTQHEQEKSPFARFKSSRPAPVSLHLDKLVKKELLFPDQLLPLVITPNQRHLKLADWARSNQQFIEELLLKHGALLFRDFGIHSTDEFEQFASAICQDLFNENGEHPRETVSKNVYTPVFYPPDKKLLWHNENSFNASWPLKLWFFCQTPAEHGGETTIVNSRDVFQHVDARIREEFARKKVMYVRNYGEGLGLDWQTVFQTTERAQVEEYCRRMSIEFEWKPGGRLKTIQIRPAVAKHPKTGEFVWWNQAAHWHISCLEPEVRSSLLSLFKEEDLPRAFYYGDGSPIENAVIESICQAYQKLEICFPWRQGDILLIDNMLTAHARNSYQGQRKIYVSMGDMIRLDDLPA